MENNFKALHYDGTISLHSNLRAAMNEAVQRLEPWREGSDRVVQQVNETSGSKLSRILVVNSVNEPTDAASHISPSGDWLDARQCVPAANQKVVAVYFQNGQEPSLDDARIISSQTLRFVCEQGDRPRRVLWRPLPALPDECEPVRAAIAKARGEAE